MRDDVVHLARQPGPFLGPGLLGEQVALPLGAFGPVPQRPAPSRAGRRSTAPSSGPTAVRSTPIVMTSTGRLPGPGHDERQHAHRRERGPPVLAVVERPVCGEDGSERAPRRSRNWPG